MPTKLKLKYKFRKKIVIFCKDSGKLFQEWVVKEIKLIDLRETTDHFDSVLPKSNIYIMYMIYIQPRFKCSTNEIARR